MSNVAYVPVEEHSASLLTFLFGEASEGSCFCGKRASLAESLREVDAEVDVPPAFGFVRSATFRVRRAPSASSIQFFVAFSLLQRDRTR